jgi:hypothetical protein
MTMRADYPCRRCARLLATLPRRGACLVVEPWVRHVTAWDRRRVELSCPAPRCGSVRHVNLPERCDCVIGEAPPLPGTATEGPAKEETAA